MLSFSMESAADHIMELNSEMDKLILRSNKQEVSKNLLERKVSK